MADRPGHPLRLAVDGSGFVWRVYADHWSMAPSNPDNEAIPEPITYYDPVIVPETAGRSARRDAALAKLRELAHSEPEQGHFDADRVLVDLIDDSEIAEAFDAIGKWYA